MSGYGAIALGEEASEQLEYVPSSLHMIVHARFRYACRACQEHVALADKPPQPIDKGLPGPGLLAQTVTSKYSDHLPLYRLEDIYARHGVVLSPATLCGWLASCAELVTPLYGLMVKRVLDSDVVHTDDTRVPVLDLTLPETRTGRFGCTSATSAIRMSCTTTRRGGPGTGRSGSSRGTGATSRPTRSPATTGCAPAPT